MKAERFQIHVAESVLEDLRARLQRARWTTVSGRAGEPDWGLGTDPAYLRELCHYWGERYDWRQQEATLNATPQFRARIGPAMVHFVHVEAESHRSTPLLLLHGWPDSFYRFHKVIPLLTAPAGSAGNGREAFTLVVPSLPGFAFTGAVPFGPHQPTRQSAELLWRLMTEVLGYRRFAVAGGDGGSVLAQLLAIDHPDSIIGIHLTDLGWHATTVDPSSVSKLERTYLEAARKSFMADGAYAMVQSTRPRTLAPVLEDSPVALASWIVDRFHAWSDPTGGTLESRFSKDELLTNLMIYWVTRTIGSSIFSYCADARSPSLTTTDRVERPVGLALFPHEPGGVPPLSLAGRTLNVRRWTEMPRGGHFAAWEVPELYAREVVEFFRPLVAAESVERREERRDAHPAF